MAEWVECESKVGDICHVCEEFVTGDVVWMAGDRKVCDGCYHDMVADAEMGYSRRGEDD